MGRFVWIAVIVTGINPCLYYYEEVNMKVIMLKLNDDLHIKLRIKCLQQQTTMQDKLNELIENYTG